MADAIKTLEEEFQRDGCPWVLRDHVSVSGDYSLQLLQWLLLRHSADCQEGYYFTSSNLIDLEHIAPQALQAQTLAGGLVHLPRQDNKHHGHWVCFTRHGKSALESSYFWMDSTSGFQAMSKTDLELKLSTLQSVTGMQSEGFIVYSLSFFIAFSW
jgi:hypothetical protein